MSPSKCVVLLVKYTHKKSEICFGLSMSIEWPMEFQIYGLVIFVCLYGITDKQRYIFKMYCEFNSLKPSQQLPKWNVKNKIILHYMQSLLMWMNVMITSICNEPLEFFYFWVITLMMIVIVCLVIEGFQWWFISWYSGILLDSIIRFRINKSNNCRKGKINLLLKSSSRPMSGVCYQQDALGPGVWGLLLGDFLSAKMWIDLRENWMILSIWFKSCSLNTIGRSCLCCCYPIVSFWFLMRRSLAPTGANLYSYREAQPSGRPSFWLLFIDDPCKVTL